jgi:hypothetical protein
MSCGSGDSPQATAVRNASASLLIAPLLSGEYFCDAALTSPNVITEDDAAFFCAAEGTNGAHVGEMHPLVALTPAQYLAMFEQHRTNGAVLVAPFYMSVFPQSRNPTSNLGQYLIAPYYPDFASDLYYAAIQNALTQ